MRLELDLPMPPSGNRIYFIWKRGKRSGISLTTEAKQYKRMMADVLLRDHAVALGGLDQDAAYRLVLCFHMHVYNKGWPDKAQSRYKKADISNRILLLENGLKDTTGIDDCQNFELVVLKTNRTAEEEEHVRLMYEAL